MKGEPIPALGKILIGSYMEGNMPKRREKILRTLLVFFVAYTGFAILLAFVKRNNTNLIAGISNT
ncbi:hypothetical protein GCM10027286_17900 [Virgibacillus ainsalahensis]